jgi:hypothetical protein
MGKLNFKWESWLLILLTGVIIPWGTWVTISIYDVKQDVAVRTEQIKTMQLNSDKVSIIVDKMNDNIQQMKQEQVRQGTILENIQKQLTQNITKDGYAFKWGNNGK